MGEVKRNDAVSFMRVAAMFMIISAHMLQSWGGSRGSVVAQVLVVGVEIFLIISGFLYARKSIGSPSRFIARRWVKVCTPMYIWVIIITITAIIIGTFDFGLALVVHLLDLQGLSRLLRFAELPTVPGAEHLWFFTPLMIDYVLLAAVKTEGNIESRINGERRTWLIVAAMVICEVLSCYVMVELRYIVAYFVGYLMGLQEESFNRKTYLRVTVIMAVALFATIVGRDLADGTVLYDRVISGLSHIALASWLFMTGLGLYSRCHDGLHHLVISSPWRWLEGISLYLYVTHYAFLKGPLSVTDLSLTPPFKSAPSCFCRQHLLSCLNNFVRGWRNPCWQEKFLLKHESDWTR